MMKKTVVLISCGVLTVFSAGCATTTIKPASAATQTSAQHPSTAVSNSTVTNDSSAPEKVGYSSETAFSQAFKRQHGQSPSHYRKQS